MVERGLSAAASPAIRRRIEPPFIAQAAVIAERGWSLRSRQIAASSSGSIWAGLRWGLRSRSSSPSARATATAQPGRCGLRSIGSCRPCGANSFMTPSTLRLDVLARTCSGIAASSPSSVSASTSSRRAILAKAAGRRAVTVAAGASGTSTGRRVRAFTDRRLRAPEQRVRVPVAEHPGGRNVVRNGSSRTVEDLLGPASDEHRLRLPMTDRRSKLTRPARRP